MTVSLDLRDTIAVIEIDDGNKNVINHEVLDELEVAWTEAEETSRAILLKGREGCFCAGYDIQVMTGGDRDASARLGSRGARLATRIYGCPKPVVGLAEGHAFTIGLVWLSGCDVRIAEEGPFKMAMTEVALGVPLSGWALDSVRARLNPAHEVAALLHSRRHSPDEALQAGFVDQVVPAGQGLETALAEASRLAELPSEAYEQTKLALRKSVLDVMSATA